MKKNEGPLELNNRIDERARVSSRLRVVAFVGGAAAVVAMAYLFNEMREARSHQAPASSECTSTGGPHGECRLPPLKTE